MSSQPQTLSLACLGVDDLARANAIVEAAVMSWSLSDRVKRLSLPSYRYHLHDLDHLTLVGASDASGRLLGVAAWEPPEADEPPAGKSALLLHGIFVDPGCHRCGVGSRLLLAAVEAARARGVDGLLVKATRDALGFFEARGLERLPVERPDRDYPHRYWLSLSTAD